MATTYSFDTPTPTRWRETFRSDLSAAMKRRRITQKDLARSPVRYGKM